MRYEEIKCGQLVYDRWWPERGDGRVVAKFKTRIKIRFPHGIETYDLKHIQFLKMEK